MAKLAALAAALLCVACGPIYPDYEIGPVAVYDHTHTHEVMWPYLPELVRESQRAATRTTTCAEYMADVRPRAWGPAEVLKPYNLVVWPEASSIPAPDQQCGCQTYYFAVGGVHYFSRDTPGIYDLDIEIRYREDVFRTAYLHEFFAHIVPGVCGYGFNAGHAPEWQAFEAEQTKIVRDLLTKKGIYPQ